MKFTGESSVGWSARGAKVARENGCPWYTDTRRVAAPKGYVES